MQRLRAFLLGMWEFRLSWTWKDPAEPHAYTDLDSAYDRGREWAHRLTFRRFDN